MLRSMLMLFLLLTGCAQTEYVYAPIHELTPEEITYYATRPFPPTPNPFYSNAANEWTIYQTPHGNYTNLGGGMMLGPDGLYIPY